MTHKLHHVGMLVESIEESLSHYQKLFSSAQPTETFTIAAQGVSVAFLPIGTDVLLEFVEPDSENNTLWKLKRKGASFYHLGFLVDDFEVSREEFINTGFKLVSEFESEAFAGRRCAFLLSPGSELIELVEGEGDKRSG